MPRANKSLTRSRKHIALARRALEIKKKIKCDDGSYVQDIWARFGLQPPPQPSDSTPQPSSSISTSTPQPSSTSTPPPPSSCSTSTQPSSTFSTSTPQPSSSFSTSTPQPSSTFSTSTRQPSSSFSTSTHQPSSTFSTSNPQPSSPFSTSTQHFSHVYNSTHQPSFPFYNSTHQPSFPFYNSTHQPSFPFYNSTHQPSFPFYNSTHQPSFPVYTSTQPFSPFYTSTPQPSSTSTSPPFSPFYTSTPQPSSTSTQPLSPVYTATPQPSSTSTPQSSSPSTSTPQHASPFSKCTSAEKRRTLMAEKSDIATIKPSDEAYMRIKEKSIEKLAKRMLCPSCRKANSNVQFIHRQADTYVRVECRNTKCKLIIDTREDEKNTVKKNVHPTTLLIVYCVMLLGYAYTGAEKLCAFLQLKHLTFNSFRRYSIYITELAEKHVASVLERSRRAVFEYYIGELGKQPDSDGILDIDVTFDGSWHRRGYKSNLGTGAVIDIHTGLIVDYANLCKMCSPCNVKNAELKRGGISEEKYRLWKADHAPLCHQNFSGTSGGMEIAAAVKMWQRSLDHKLRYMTFISDGDSKAYVAVTQLNGGNGPYGPNHFVIKNECVNHVAKRLSAGLLNLRKTSPNEQQGVLGHKRTMGGKSILPLYVIENLSHYFGVSVRRRVGTTASEMRDEILSSFYHCSSSDEQPKHHLCPNDSESWCFYNKALARGERPESHSKMLGYYQIVLEPHQLAEVKKIYDRLTTDEMMVKCLKGMTQNSNESLHARIWRICPKHKNASRRILDFATATAVCNYNFGYSNSSLLSLFGIPPSKITQSFLEKQDKVMTVPYKKKKKVVRRLMKEKDYTAGGF